MEIPEPATLFDDYSGRSKAPTYQRMEIANHLNDRDLKLVAASGTEAEIVLSVTRAPIEDESVPSVRMTPTLFPGLFP